MTKEGTVLDGKYEILKEIGRGGMSIVYLARDNRLNKQWAVKEIKNDGSKSTQTLLKGLEREANILKNVDHPVLPRIVDIINSRGTIYVVMDFIEGTNLGDVLKQEGAQSQEDVIEWGRELASALDYLHSMNPPIIYRDMKPANVMLKPEGGVKLIDFGTAKEYTIESNADTTALGTRGYAAPEQFGDAQGRGIYKTDARTDIYNLGATLYHMVTGMNPCEPPYEIKPIRQWNQALSTGLEQIIMKCTQPNPDDRYQSCSELLYALDHYTELDDSYKKANKKKVILFGVSAAMTIAAAITAIVGYNGMKRVERENYSAYIEEGNDLKIQQRYPEAAEQYKKAFDLDSDAADAYVNYINLYIDASNDPNVTAANALKVDDGLTTVANRVSNSDSSASKNAEVLYRLGLAYFTKENPDYTAADKYFRMVPSDDPTYGELAGYYEGIAFIRSGSVENVTELMARVNSFADYNVSHFSNTDEQKFINYQTLGSIYAMYVTTEGVAEKGEQVMSQALEDLESYDGDNALRYEYDYYNDLSEIYFQLAKTSEDANQKNTYYNLAISACQEVISQIEGLLATGTDNEKMVGYRKSYEEKMSRIAEIYGAEEKFTEACETYEKAEAKLTELAASKSAANENLGRIYTKHLAYVYQVFAAKNQDITKWSTQDKNTILAIYKNGSKVSGIEKNSNWVKRVVDMQELEKSGSTTEEKGE
ncbi:MAG: protein kinase [Eubacterium sp.]|nr:protein kinase [Eubacterium sp.]